MNEIEQIKNKLWDEWWRLTSGKLYHIKTKEWLKIPFIPKPAQLDLLEDVINNWVKRNIILKARQLWFTTLISIYLLDKALFFKNKNIWFVAQDMDNAEKIFQDKIIFAFNNLPEWLKTHYELERNRTREIRFKNNGSSIMVDTSFRWWTYQYIHISEFGKICNLYPIKAKEIITGTLNTVWKDGTIFIESTAEWNSWYFFEMCKTAQEKNPKHMTKLDYKFRFYPWYNEKEYILDDDIPIPQELDNYFNTLSVELNKKFNHNQKVWYYKMLESQWDDMKREYPSIPKEAFDMAIKWAYYEKELTTARNQNRIWKIEYNPALDVHTAWDLWWAGWWDDTAIWFYQIYGKEIRIIDYWEWNWYSMVEIINQIINKKWYTYWKHYAPHDIKVHEYSSWSTRLNTAKENWLTFKVLPKLTISDWINKVREIFSRCRFDEMKCKRWIDMLSKYQRQYDEKNGVFRDKPLHNDASNWADAFRYLAVWIKEEQPEKKKEKRQYFNPILWEMVRI